MGRGLVTRSKAGNFESAPAGERAEGSPHTSQCNCLSNDQMKCKYVTANGWLWGYLCDPHKWVCDLSTSLSHSVPIETVPGRTLKEDSGPFLKECQKGSRQEESNISRIGESVFCPSLGQSRL